MQSHGRAGDTCPLTEEERGRAGRTVKSVKNGDENKLPTNGDDCGCDGGEKG